MGCALSPSAVRDEPQIYLSQNSQEGDEGDRRSKSDRGDLLARFFWETGHDCIMDVQVTNLDAKSYQNRSPASILSQMERNKKRKYLAGCSEQRRHFSPLIVSLDGIFGFEANNIVKRLSGMIARKWHKPYSWVCAFVRGRLSIAVIREVNRCIRGSRVPAKFMSLERPLWEDGSGLGGDWGH